MFFQIFSNGIYKSILHRVLVNSLQSRISIASLHSMPVEKVIGPATELVSESTPKQFMDTDFSAFLEYISSTEFKKKNFLESRKLTCTRDQRTEGQPCWHCMVLTWQQVMSWSLLFCVWSSQCTAHFRRDKVCEWGYDQEINKFKIDSIGLKIGSRWPNNIIEYGRCYVMQLHKNE